MYKIFNLHERPRRKTWKFRNRMTWKDIQVFFVLLSAFKHINLFKATNRIWTLFSLLPLYILVEFLSLSHRFSQWLVGSVWFLSYSSTVWITLHYAIILSQTVLFLCCQIHKINGKLKVLNQLYNLLSSTYWWKPLQATSPPVLTIYLRFMSVQDILVNSFLLNTAILDQFSEATSDFILKYLWH